MTPGTASQHPHAPQEVSSGGGVAVFYVLGPVHCEPDGVPDRLQDYLVALNAKPEPRAAGQLPSNEERRSRAWPLAPILTA